MTFQSFSPDEYKKNILWQHNISITYQNTGHMNVLHCTDLSLLENTHSQSTGSLQRVYNITIYTCNGEYWRASLAPVTFEVL